MFEANRLVQNRHCAGRGEIVGRTAANEDDTRGGMFCDDVAAGGRAVELRHLEIHQDDVRPMPIVGMDGFQARADNLDHLMLAKTNKLRQRGSDAFLVVSNQDAHTAVAELSMPTQFLAIRPWEPFQSGVKRDIEAEIRMEKARQAPCFAATNTAQ